MVPSANIIIQIPESIGVEASKEDESAAYGELQGSSGEKNQ
ncbi:MAG: hypothetical protein R3A45_11055 [Bdellovibrionota bacterium]